MSLFQTGVRPLVDDYLLKKAEEVRDYGEYWSASSAGYCMRRVIFERLGVPKVASDNDARKQRVFQSGHLFHEWIQSITKKAGLSIAQELELQDEELMIRGHIDDLVLITGEEVRDISKHGLYGKPNQLILYDYKTQNSRAFSYERPDMSYYHKMQLGTYMYMLRKSNDAVILILQAITGGDIKSMTKEQAISGLVSEARILKISKDDLRMNEEQLLWTPDLKVEVLKYWRDLNTYWANKKIPPCTCNDYEKITNPKSPDFGKGFMSLEKWNGYYFNGQPCSIDWYNEWKAKK